MTLLGGSFSLFDWKDRLQNISAPIDESSLCCCLIIPNLDSQQQSRSFSMTNSANLLFRAKTSSQLCGYTIVTSQGGNSLLLISRCCQSKLYNSYTMQFASQTVRQSLARTGDPSMIALRQTTRRRYQQTLRFMQEWTSDLLQRQNELQQQRNELYTSSTKQESSKQPVPSSTFNVQNLIKGEFLKRVESLYMKQLVLADMSQSQQSHMSHRTDSLNHTYQSNNTFAEGNPMLDHSGVTDIQEEL